MKKRIRITESDLHRIVRESVNRILREESEEDIPMDIPERIPDENPGEEDDLDSITDYKVLKSMAKDAGINPFGKTKDEIRTAIREKRAEEGQ